MIVGVPKEIKEQENRVALTPAGVDALVELTRVLVETTLIGAGFTDDEYSALGQKYYLKLQVFGKI